MGKEIRNEEIILVESRTIVSKTDPKGIIEYTNDYFEEVCGYSKEELLGKAHNIIRHPDMPKIIFKVLWDELKKGNDVRVVVKNLAKDGRYYWVITNFFTVYDDKGNITGYYARRKAVPKHVKVIIEDLYQKLLIIENEAGMEVAEEYLKNYLNNYKTDLQGFVEHLFGQDKELIEKYLKQEVSDEDILAFEKSLNFKKNKK